MRQPAEPALSPALREDLVRTGYYPTLVEDVVDVAVAGEPCAAHLVHAETTFDGEEIRRHVTVLVLTATRLVTVHVDDQPADSERPAANAVATSESVPLREVRCVSLTHVVPTPEKHRVGDVPVELTVAIGWGAVSRVELEPAGCSDPTCEADHGLTGQILPDDLVLRVSAEAEGADAVRRAATFARALSAATAR
ncbi:DUF5998 family protein [Luteimicrobium subarcticum]|uniref:DUF5998 family protein n=1 Tax=Luteimicrobium subarcticum TaxID=620910 RepID=UPI000C2410C7|nr:DUF5998 family protein [Luteimicrobium subarcticum]